MGEFNKYFLAGNDFPDRVYRALKLFHYPGFHLFYQTLRDGKEQLIILAAR